MRWPATHARFRAQTVKRTWDWPSKVQGLPQLWCCSLPAYRTLAVQGVQLWTGHRPAQACQRILPTNWKRQAPRDSSYSGKKSDECLLAAQNKFKIPKGSLVTWESYCLVMRQDIFIAIQPKVLACCWPLGSTSIFEFSGSWAASLKARSIKLSQNCCHARIILACRSAWDFGRQICSANLGEHHRNGCNVKLLSFFVHCCKFPGIFLPVALWGSLRWKFF